MHWQPDSSDYWVRARVYRPQLGRWVSRDPLRREANHYLYVRNRPAKLRDPSGRAVGDVEHDNIPLLLPDRLLVCRCRVEGRVHAYLVEFWQWRWWAGCGCKCYYCERERRWTEPGHCRMFCGVPDRVPLDPSCKKALAGEFYEWGQDCCDWIADTLHLMGEPRDYFMKVCYTDADMLGALLQHLVPRAW